MRAAKRAMDLALAIVALPIVLPVTAVAVILVRVKLGGPVLFREQRIGLDGRPFVFYKLRTMTEERDADGNLLPDHDRLPPLGAALRRWSVDELPSVFAVLKGDMSIVGPRPLSVRYRDRYSPEQMRRHEAKPGITGWAQINGRNSLGWQEKFAHDVWYVDHRTLWLDLKIVAHTVAIVASGRGISADGHETMPEFRGNEGD